MSALQIWLQNHNRKMTQDAIDEALMEYIAHVEKQRDELIDASTELLNSLWNAFENQWEDEAVSEAQLDAIGSAKRKLLAAIATVKGSAA